MFEGMKAQRSAQGRIVLFRPDENAARMMAGALPAMPFKRVLGIPVCQACNVASETLMTCQPGDLFVTRKVLP